MQQDKNKYFVCFQKLKSIKNVLSRDVMKERLFYRYFFYILNDL